MSPDTINVVRSPMKPLNVFGWKYFSDQIFLSKSSMVWIKILKSSFFFRIILLDKQRFGWNIIATR